MSAKRPRLQLPRIAADSPQTRTALGYLSTNCGSCHNRDSSIAKLGLILKDPIAERTECSAAIATTLDQRGHWVVPEAPAQSRMINPGQPDASAIVRRLEWQRLGSRCETQGR